MSGAQGAEVGPGGLTLEAGPDDAGPRTFDVSQQQLTDGSGRRAGQLVVLREVTERVRDRERLEQVLHDRSRVAAALQASMVPRRLPDLPATELASRYQPAGDGGEIGGDFLDVFPLGAGSWAFVLGDVSGKGAEAAAVSAAARYTVRALAGTGSGPAATLREVNARLLVQNDTERHCTLVHGHLVPADEQTPSMSVTLTLAGHPPPLVLRGREALPVPDVGGFPIAIVDAADYDEGVLQLRPGDRICLFSDGVSEQTDAAGDEQFGAERLREFLVARHDAPAEQVVAEAARELAAWAGSDVFIDDVSIVLVEWLGDRP